MDCAQLSTVVIRCAGLLLDPRWKDQKLHLSSTRPMMIPPPRTSNLHSSCLHWEVLKLSSIQTWAFCLVWMKLKYTMIRYENCIWNGLIYSVWKKSSLIKMMLIPQYFRHLKRKTARMPPKLSPVESVFITVVAHHFTCPCLDWSLQLSRNDDVWRKRRGLLSVGFSIAQLSSGSGQNTLYFTL